MANRKCAKCRRHDHIVVAYEHHKCPYRSCTCSGCHPKRSAVKLKRPPGRPSHSSIYASLPANQVMLPAKVFPPPGCKAILNTAVNPGFVKSCPTSLIASHQPLTHSPVSIPGTSSANAISTKFQKFNAPGIPQKVTSFAAKLGYSSFLRIPISSKSANCSFITSSEAATSKANCTQFSQAEKIEDEYVDVEKIEEEVVDVKNEKKVTIGCKSMKEIFVASRNAQSRLIWPLVHDNYVIRSVEDETAGHMTVIKNATYPNSINQMPMTSASAQPRSSIWSNVSDNFGTEGIGKEMADNVMVKKSDPNSMQQAPMTLASAQLTFPVLSNNVHDIDIHDVKKEADEDGLMDVDNIGISDLKITDVKSIPEELPSCSNAYASCEENSSIMKEEVSIGHVKEEVNIGHMKEEVNIGHVKEEVNIGHMKTVANDSNEVQHTEALQDIPTCSSVCENCRCTEISEERYAFLRRQEFKKLMINMYMFHRTFPDVQDKFYLPVLAACDGDFIVACSELEYINVHKKCSDSLKLKLKTYGEEFERRKMAKVMHFLKQKK